MVSNPAWACVCYFLNAFISQHSQGQSRALEVAEKCPTISTDFTREPLNFPRYSGRHLGPGLILPWPDTTLTEQNPRMDEVGSDLWVYLVQPPLR